VISSRRFPPPWTVEETDACFIVKDHTGHSLAYVYLEEEPGRRIGSAPDDARRGAADCGEHRQIGRNSAPRCFSTNKHFR